VPRFPIKKTAIVNQQAIITGPDYRHIVRVLRLKPGNEITLYDDESTEHLAQITEIRTKEIEVAIMKSNRIITESELSIILMQGLPKGDKMAYIVEKATELGVKAIIPVITERSQVRQTNRDRRWERIAIEASKQCGRVIPPKIFPIRSFRSVIEDRYESTLKIIFYENSIYNIKEYFSNNSQPPLNIAIFIGPEGGFSEGEIKLASEQGFTPLGLGPRILRTETASIVTIAVLQHLFGDI